MHIVENGQEEEEEEEEEAELCSEARTESKEERRGSLIAFDGLVIISMRRKRERMTK